MTYGTKSCTPIGMFCLSYCKDPSNIFFHIFHVPPLLARLVTRGRRCIMIRCRLLVIVVVISAVAKISSTESTEDNLKQCKFLTNGCSNFGLLREFERFFTTACNIHDVCYNCVSCFERYYNKDTLHSTSSKGNSFLSS